MFCSHCGAEVGENAVVCVKCGCAVHAPGRLNLRKSEKDWTTTLLLCFFLGGLGVHRFYVGKTGTGILQLLTLGACGIWTLVDFIMIACGNFTDAEDKVILSK